LPRDPLVEERRARHGEARQQIAPIEGDRSLELVEIRCATRGRECLLEGDDIDPRPALGIEADGLAGDEEIGLRELAQIRQDHPQIRPCFAVGEFAPQQGGEGLAPAWLSGHRQVGQECLPLAVGEARERRRPLRDSESPEQLEAQCVRHWGHHESH
jgi:hypothetical protein